jgi:hypothetical protein
MAVVAAASSGTSTECYPSWHAIYAPLATGTQVTVFSGCGLNAAGNIGCAPETMRANAEAQLKRLAPANLFDGRLSLDAYTLARYMQSEVGSGPVEERVAVGEAAVNRAKLEGLSQGVLSLLLFRQRAGHPNRGFYGPIHGPSGVTTAPYGRWASTSKDPTVLTLLLAKLILSGGTANFARGADDQVGLEHTAAFPDPAAFVRRQAEQGDYWVGPLPGVDHWRTFLVRHLGIKPSTPTGAVLLQQGLNAVANRARPNWPTSMPVCAAPAPGASPESSDGARNFLIGFALIGSLVGLGWLALRVAKGLATRTPTALADGDEDEDDYDIDWGRG